ncbi:hypothetical protein D9M72_514370 [compost metagenome]
MPNSEQPFRRCFRLSLGDKGTSQDEGSLGCLGLRVAKGVKDVRRRRVFAIERPLRIGAQGFQAGPSLKFALGIGDLKGRNAALAGNGNRPGQDVTVECIAAHGIAHGNRGRRLPVGEGVEARLQIAVDRGDDRRNGIGGFVDGNLRGLVRYVGFMRRNRYPFRRFGTEGRRCEQRSADDGGDRQKI